jgi:hypothetical protein
VTAARPSQRLLTLAQTPAIGGRDSPFRLARSEGELPTSPGRSAGPTRPVDALPARRRSSQDRKRLDLLVTLVLMAAALFALCLMLGEMPAMG